jgi:hypothetical protein
MKQQQWRSSAIAVLMLGGMGKRGGEDAVRNGGGRLLLEGPGERRGGSNVQ